MSDSVQIKIEGLNEVQDSLNRLLKSVKDLSPLMLDISETIYAAVEKNFDTEGERLGEKWPDLKDSTKAARAEKGHSETMLRAADKLFEAIISEHDNMSAVVGVGSNIPYAKIHQFGGPIKEHTVKPRDKKGLFWPGAKHPMKQVTIPAFDMPARPYLGLNDDDLANITELVREYIEVNTAP